MPSSKDKIVHLIFTIKIGKTKRNSVLETVYSADWPGDIPVDTAFTFKGDTFVFSGIKSRDEDGTLTMVYAKASLVEIPDDIMREYHPSAHPKMLDLETGEVTDAPKIGRE